MIRVLYHVIPFLMPFVVYAMYVYMRRHEQKEGEQLHDTPWYWLVVTGMGLSIASVVALWLFGSSLPGGQYEPAATVDGKVQQGKIER
jgi:hypothetical protein